MPSTFSTNLGIELITTGEQAGTWGATTNTNLGTLIEQAISGYVAQVITDGADTVITIPSGSTGVARNMTLELTGALSAARNLIVPSNRKLYFIYNNTTGGYAVTVKVSGQTGVSVPNGAKVLLVSNGTDVVNAVNYIPALYFSAGTAAAPSISTIGDTNTGIYFPAADEVGVSTGGTERLRVNSSGNLGLGVTPSAWNSSTKNIQNPAGSLFSINTTDSGVSQNLFLDSTGTWKYVNTAAASYFAQSSGSFAWASVGSGTAGATASLTTKMTLDASGNLGIGVTGPTAKLHIYEPTAAATRIRVLANGGQQAALQLAGNGTTFGTTSFDVFQDGGSDAYVANRANAALQFWTNNQERARITSGGVFAVGRAAAVGSEMLSVNGGARLETFADIIGGAGTPELRLYQNSGNWAIQNSAGNLLFYDMDAAATRVTVDGSGNLGLGVTPSAWGGTGKALQMTSGSSIAANGAIGINSNAYYDGSVNKYITTNPATQYVQGSGVHYWYTAPSGTAGNAISFTQAMTLDASGNLGVGTTSPFSSSGQTTLTVNGSSVGRIELWSGGTSRGYFAGLSGEMRLAASSTNPLTFETNSSERARITSDGNLGVGVTSPTFRLDVNGGAGNGIRYTNTANSIEAILATSADSAQIGSLSSHPVQFLVGGSERARIDSSGNLGLGVTPSEKLEIYKSISYNADPALYFRIGTNDSAVNNNVPYSWRTGITGSATGYNYVFQTLARTESSWVERARITSGGDLGIGATSPQAAVNIERSSSAGTVAAGASIILSNRNSASGTFVAGGIFSNTYRDITTSQYTAGVWFEKQNSATAGTAASQGAIVFGANDYTEANNLPVERARITSNGNLVIGDTAAIASDCKLSTKNSTAATATAGLWNATTAGDSVFLGFGTETTYTSRGSIDYNRAGGLVRYNTTSDYRAKDIIGPVQNPGATIDALKVYEGKMKGATQSRPMLIAHEAQAHAPYAVSGVKDEVNEDGTPKFQQIDVSSLVPLLLAEIQSLRARVATLESN